MSTTALISRTAGADARRAPLPRSRRAPALDLPEHATAGTVVAAVAARRDLWAAHVRFDPAAPVQAVVWHDESWEVVLGAWLPGQRAALVEQLDRPGALHVLQGELEETTWVTATDGPEPGRRHSVARRYPAGATRSHGSVHVHDVRNPGPDTALALAVRARA